MNKQTMCLGISYKKNKRSKSITNLYFRTFSDLKRWHKQAKREHKKLFIQEARLIDLKGDTVQNYIIIPKESLGIR